VSKPLTGEGVAQPESHADQRFVTRKAQCG
jgi:hypothetical protein